MDENRSAGIGKKISGKVKETVGKVTGNKKMEAEGKAEQVAGGTQETYGEAKDKIKKETTPGGRP
jgi:uncharacterized protein YjbJ (UPF0337 family)